MEPVYIAGIVVVGVVIVAVVWLLRARLKSAEGSASWKEKEIGGKVETFSPKTVSSPPVSQDRQPSVDVSGNILLGSGIIRVWRNSVRVARNWLLGRRSSIEVKDPPSKKERR